MKSMVINLVTVGKEGIPPTWLIKFKRFEELGYKLYLNSGLDIVEFSLRKISPYKFNSSFKHFSSLPTNKISPLRFSARALMRNLIALTKMRKLYKLNPDVIYSPSAVLDLVIVPYIYKLFRNSFVWAIVFDNTVPLVLKGQLVNHLLARIFYLLSLPLVKSANVIFTVTEDLQAYLIKQGISNKKILMRGNGIELKQIKKAKFNKKYETDLLFVGRIHEDKGIFDLLYVVSQLKKDFEKIKLGIIGSGDHQTESRVIEMIKDFKLKNNVIIWGFVAGQEKFNHMMSTRCFVSLSYYESFGLSVSEAIFMGKNVVIYDLPVYRQIHSLHSVEIVPLGDKEEAAKRVLSLMRLPDSKNIIGNFEDTNINSWGRIAQAEIGFIQNIIHN